MRIRSSEGEIEICKHSFSFVVESSLLECIQDQFPIRRFKNFDPPLFFFGFFPLPPSSREKDSTAHPWFPFLSSHQLFHFLSPSCGLRTRLQGFRNFFLVSKATTVTTCASILYLSIIAATLPSYRLRCPSFSGRDPPDDGCRLWISSLLQQVAQCEVPSERT